MTHRKTPDTPAPIAPPVAWRLGLAVTLSALGLTVIGARRTVSRLPVAG